jgi:hypothetical protein
VETLRNGIVIGFQTIRNMPEIWDRLRLAMRRPVFRQEVDLWNIYSKVTRRAVCRRQTS